MANQCGTRLGTSFERGKETPILCVLSKEHEGPCAARPVVCKTCENDTDSIMHRYRCADGEDFAAHDCAACKQPLGIIWVEAASGQRACCFECMGSIL
jgi:hypothetical protein